MPLFFQPKKHLWSFLITALESQHFSNKKLSSGGISAGQPISGLVISSPYLWVVHLTNIIATLGVKLDWFYWGLVYCSTKGRSRKTREARARGWWGSWPWRCRCRRRSSCSWRWTTPAEEKRRRLRSTSTEDPSTDLARRMSTHLQRSKSGENSRPDIWRPSSS